MRCPPTLKFESSAQQVPSRVRERSGRKRQDMRTSPHRASPFSPKEVLANFFATSGLRGNNDTPVARHVRPGGVPCAKDAAFGKPVSGYEPVVRLLCSLKYLRFEKRGGFQHWGCERQIQCVKEVKRAARNNGRAAFHKFTRAERGNRNLEQATQTSLCKSVFSEGEQKPSPERFTQAWVELINRMERNKNIAAGISQ